MVLAISACSDENNSNNDKSSGDKSETLDPVSGFYTDTLTHDGELRQYLTYIPDIYLSLIHI